MASSIPVYRIDAREVDDAYEAYRALCMAAQGNPALTQNKYFTALQDTAYARFLMTFEAL